MTKLGKESNTQVKDLSSYNSEMSRPLLDKAFFLDKVGKSNFFIDYGCADGALIEFLHRISPDSSFVGYDEQIEMVESAKKRFNDAKFHNKIRFTNDWLEVQNYLKINAHLKDDPMVSCLILSSVIHEFYAYKRNVIDLIWDQIFSSGADYIALRDMMVSDTASRQSDPIVVAKIRQRYQLDALRDFESTWGSLNDNWSLIHFLLKYRYVKNWDRELRENYLPLSLERLLALIPPHYEPIFWSILLCRFCVVRSWRILTYSSKSVHM